MPSSGVSAASIAARLSALGLRPRIKEHARYTAVEATIPESLPAESWGEVLAAVGEADRFGLLATSSNVRTLWAVVRKSVPTTGYVGGPGYQR
ncbi:hypothetical protein [Streptomyces sp. NPDC060198]|uniref:hypothetical protein n=1 Tax=Streptomyces sp. NPDC060198 TaxID=3347070 RepID=UPI0036584E93